MFKIKDPEFISYAVYKFPINNFFYKKKSKNSRQRACLWFGCLGLQYRRPTKIWPAPIQNNQKPNELCPVQLAQAYYIIN